MNTGESNNFAISYLKGKLTKWRIISFILFLFILIPLIRKFYFQNDAQNDMAQIMKNKNFIAHMSISGIIADGENFNISKWIQTLKDLQNKENVHGLLIEINSPGGAVVPSYEIYQSIRDFANTTKKPVVTLIKDMAASGGYLISLAGDHLVAHPSSVTGSVGVIFAGIDTTELAQKIGIKPVIFKSGPLKAVPNPGEKIDSLAKEMMHDIIGSLKNQFIGLVKERRSASMNEDGLNKVEQAGIFTGEQALKIGLVDSLGGFENACNWLKEKNNGTEYEVIKIDMQEKSDFLKRFLKQGVKENLKPLMYFSESLMNQNLPEGFYLMYKS